MNIEIRKVEKEELLGTLFEQFHRLWSAKWLESLPDEPLLTQEDARFSIEDDKDSFEDRYLAFSGTEVVGYASVGCYNPSSHDYELNKELGWVDGCVSPEKRNHGVGIDLTKKAIESALNMGLKKIGSSSYLENGRKFIEKLGGFLISKYSERQLGLERFDWSIIDNWLKIRNNLDPCLRIELHTEINDDFIEKVVDIDHEISCELRAMSNVEFRQTREGAIDRWRQAVQWIERLGDKYICFLLLDSSGKAIGYTHGRVSKENTDRYYQFETGVAKIKRGLGFGKLLKALMLDYIRYEFPQVKTVSTGSNDLNDPMHGINNILGFSNGVTRSSYRILVDEAVKRLGNL